MVSLRSLTVSLLIGIVALSFARGAYGQTEADAVKNLP